MKKLTKPISSPGRTEKFPPPLMRFLRSNVGSKSSSSRGRRSRASPMFIRKKNAVIETTQEPSSPKVTCIGQVRVRRSKKNKNTTTKTTVRHHHPSSNRNGNRLCRCLRKLRPKSCCTFWSKWVSCFDCFRCGCCKKSTDLHDSPVTNEVTPPRKVAGDNGKEEEDDEVEERETVEGDNQGLISRSPPRNAFLLTRCRSAPYRSSSLAGKFLESSAGKTGEEEVAEKIKNLTIKENEEEEEEEEEEEINGNEKEKENEEGTCNKSNGVEELKAMKAAPLILTRCKSEPARTWDQLLV